MSTHLFKAKGAETKKWVEGYLWSERTIGVTSPCGNVDEVVIDPDTVCQYIGRTDSLGEKIFENDILLVQSRIVGYYRFVVRFGVCEESKRAEHETGYIGFYVDGYDEETKKQLKHGIRNDIVFWLNRGRREVVGNIFDETGAAE